MVSATVLKQYPFFKGFSEAELNKFEELTSDQSFKAGFQIWKKGDESKSLCLLEEGKVVLAMESYLGENRPPIHVTVDIISKGDVMGWSAVVEPHMYTLGAKCISDTKVIVLDAAKLRKIINADKDLGFKFMNAIDNVIPTRLAHTEIMLAGDRLSIMTQV
jgi:CRP-like cAMP-binding protein